MRGIIRAGIVLPSVLFGAGALMLSFWPIGAMGPAAFPAGDAARGAYLARASGCISCHTNAVTAGPALAGGAPLDTPFGSFVPKKNITPHLQAGIGFWSRALRIARRATPVAT